MEAKFTPGPWRWRMQKSLDGKLLGPIIEGSNGDRIGWSNYANKATNLGDVEPYLQSEANATLIAAAPDLLTALEALIREQRYFEEHAQQPDSMPGNQFYGDKFMAVVKMAKAAIAKARGTAPELTGGPSAGYHPGSAADLRD